jgi:RNA polymerase sigma-70 factor, ECF subfamily
LTGRGLRPNIRSCTNRFNATANREIPMADRNDEIVAEFLRNDPASIRLLASWARDVASHRAWGFETPEDIVQATLLALLSNLREGGFTGGDLRAYVRRIAKNLCVSSYRRARVRRTNVSLEDNPSAAAVATRDLDPERSALLKRVLDRLDRGSRDTIEMAYFWGLSRKEMAQRLGVSEGAAKVRLFRSLERARALVEGPS